MRGCLSLFIGIVVGVVLLAVVETLVIAPSPLPAPPPSNADLNILFHKEFLTRELQTQVSQVNSPVSLRGLAIQGQADQTLVVTGTAVAPGTSVSAPVRIVVRPSVVNNRVAVQIITAQVGTLKLPGDWFRTFESLINDDLNRTLTNTPYRIVGVSTTIEGLIVDVIVTR
jgi:hypothetical protein